MFSSDDFISYSAISSGYFLSNTPIITQIIFSISTITLSRIFEHIHDKVEGLNAALNELQEVADRIEAENKKGIDNVKEALENLVKKEREVDEFKNEEKKVAEIMTTLDDQESASAASI
ncbi:8221_t:CDS:2 [Acaulospora morrowiae]|uniref:8221_t:CDS:1 n=1 Tax=Acaulospora morrowiae TaxID=94023 RepID=A0A9N8YUI2_9GLOM|nr:8221_t:CDS:2 [Acaulospora morrowiae]